MHLPSRRLVSLLLLPLLLAACKSTPVEPTGFLSDYSRLTQGSETFLIFLDGRGLRDRDTFHVEPVEVLTGDGEVSASLRELADYTRDRIRAHLSAGGYVVVDAPGQEALHVRVALTDVTKNKTLLKILPVGVVFGAGAGGAAMEGEIVDPATGAQHAAVVQSQEGSRLPLDGLGRTSDARAIVDGWAERFVERLDAIHGRD